MEIIIKQSYLNKHQLSNESFTNGIDVDQMIYNIIKPAH